MQFGEPPKLTSKIKNLFLKFLKKTEQVGFTNLDVTLVDLIALK